VADAVITMLPNGALLLNVYKQAVPPAQQKRTAKHPQFWPLVTRVLPAVRLSSRKANNAGAIVDFGHLIITQGTAFAAGSRARHPAYHRFGRILREGGEPPPPLSAKTENNRGVRYAPSVFGFTGGGAGWRLRLDTVPA